MLNPNLFLVTFEIKLWLGLLNQVEILAWALPGKAENTFNSIEIVEEDIQDVDKPGFRQFRRAQNDRQFQMWGLPTSGHPYATQNNSNKNCD